MSIFLVLLHAASVACIFTGIKYLSQFFRSVEIVLLYKLLLFICLVLWVLRKWSYIITPITLLLVIRGILTAVASLSFMYALQHVNIVSATALTYLEQVFWVFIGVLFFRDRITKIKLIVILTSFIGAFFVLFPDVLESNVDQKLQFNSYYFFIFFAVICWCISAGMIKKIGKLVEVEIQLLYNMFFAVLVSGIVALFNWEYINVGEFSILIPNSFYPFNYELLLWDNFKYILLITVAYFVHSIAFFFAVRDADFSLIMPYDYFRLIFIGILNYFIFSDLETVSNLIGYALIVLSGLILARSEYFKKKIIF